MNLKLKIKKYGIKIIGFIALIYFSNIFDNIFNEFNIKLLEKSKSPILNFFSKIVSFFNLRIPIFTIVISAVLLWIIYRLYKLSIFHQRKLRIIEAKYGENDKYINISNELNNMVESDKLKVVLSNSIAGDPIVGTVKKGTIKYKYMGQKFEKIYKENDVIELPEANKKV